MIYNFTIRVKCYKDNVDVFLCHLIDLYLGIPIFQLFKYYEQKWMQNNDRLLKFTKIQI